ncbi:NADPH:quinone oxidoreductase family protein [Nocardia cyriacigeorgica]|uniref:NADPH:quinone oxidoreductase family protein n=1 Tax=Nocardia cyriacigeorgica TaxID=135487 RepID=UPI0013D47289|nr:NADPH:quinone oxidoreductase family protein [Nocardia cyriacigeorgica]NEW27075.1 NADPH:quinone oxidoreductase family protein [Nocardia cyriacigeorgica]
MTTVRGWRAERFGSPRAVLEVQTLDAPEVPDEGVMIRVRATGVGLPDLLMTQGGYPLVKTPPVSPGQEVVGDVVAAGPRSAFRPGDRVLALTQYAEGWGGFSDHCLAYDYRVCRAPDVLSDEQAAGFFIPFRTAYGALVHRGGVGAGETLLVLGGSGSSGATAIQVGKALGAHVIAVAAGRQSADFCRAMGADDVIDRRETPIDEAVRALRGNGTVDAIFDPVGGAASDSAVSVLAPHGRIMVVGYASGSWHQPDGERTALANHTIVGVFAGAMGPARDRATFAALERMANDGHVRTPISRVWSFDEVPSAIAALREDPQPGKMIVRAAG